MQKRYEKKGSKNKGNKKAQTMGIPFALIFSIILIVITIFVAFYVIGMFLERAEQAKLAVFISDLEDELVGVHGSYAAEKTITLELTKKIQYVCFVNLSDEPRGQFRARYDEFMVYKKEKGPNMFFYPLDEAEKYGVKSDQYIKCGKDEKDECLCLEKNQANPLCVENEGREVKLKLIKEIGKPCVRIESVRA